MPHSEARPPDYNLAMMVGNDRNPSVGSAWRQPDGSIQIRLHPGVIIQSGFDNKVKLRLFTYDPKREEKRQPQSIRGDGFDDDIPF